MNSKLIHKHSKKIMILVFCCMGLSIVSSFLSKTEDESKTGSHHESPLPELKSATSETLPTEINVSVVKESAPIPAVSSQFETPEGLEILKKQVLDSGAFLSQKKSREDFQASSLDSPLNAEHAKQLMQTQYPEDLDEEFVTQRVIAAHFLKYSKHLHAEDCTTLLESLLDQYGSVDSEKHKRAIQFDVGSLAYMCTKTGGQVFQKRIDAIKIPALKGQGRTAMTVYQEHRQRADPL
jgi:hypothetical protein